MVLDEIKSHRIAVDATTHFLFAVVFYISAFYHKREEAMDAAQYILDICRLHPSIRAEWDTNPGFYRAQLQYAIEVPEGMWPCLADKKKHVSEFLRAFFP